MQLRLANVQYHTVVSESYYDARTSGRKMVNLLLIARRSKGKESISCHFLNLKNGRGSTLPGALLNHPLLSRPLARLDQPSSLSIRLSRATSCFLDSDVSFLKQSRSFAFLDHLYEEQPRRVHRRIPLSQDPEVHRARVKTR
jgi:hypothetical protein